MNKAREKEESNSNKSSQYIRITLFAFVLQAWELRQEEGCELGTRY
jgi:hypothetical protein